MSIDCPAECIALSKGKKEVRVLEEMGRYVRYTYVDPDTGNVIKSGKETIILKDNTGKFEKIFLIPAKDRYLAIKTGLDSGEIKKTKLWDREKGCAIDLF